MRKDSTSGDFLLGGQAVIEGVLMRSPNYYTVAVRKENGQVVVRRRHQPRITERHPVLRWPVIRGIALLGQILGIGIKALNFSVAVASEEEKKGEDKADGRKGEPSKWAMALTLAVAFVIAFALIVFLPLWLTELTRMLLPALDNPILFNTVDGLFRITVFLAYILLISLLPDIMRVFQYHGAEHMTVYASESEDEVSVESAAAYSPYHPRCGTSFLLLVMIVAIMVFSLTPTHGGLLFKLLVRTPLVPLIAGISYELLRLTARLRGHRLFGFLSAPGMWLQRLTAKRPDESQLKVAVIALNEVVRLENRFKGGPIPPELEQTLQGADI